MVAQKGARKSKACRAAKKTSKKARKTPESNKPMRLTFSYDGNDVFKDIGTYGYDQVDNLIASRFDAVIAQLDS